jgi:hypothetical protein
MKGRKISYHVTFDVDTKSESDYFLLPFAVEQGTEAIRILYSYDEGDRSDPNVIDIGLLGPGETEFLRVGSFRGWSGSNKREICVSSQGATPGYYRGAIQAGKWNVLLGLYKISKGGCPCDVEIVLERGSVPSRAKAVTQKEVPSPIKETAWRWLRGDLHVHSHHSDGSLPVEGIAREARRRGLDFVAITDHNTTSQSEEIADALSTGADLGLTLIPGEELTSYRGHANVWNTTEWLDFRIRREEDARAVIEEAHRRGLLFSVNHPNDLEPWGYKGVTDFDCIEVWSGLWFRMNFQSLEWWDELSRKGLRKVAVGGSDVHTLEEGEARDLFSVGSPTTWVLSKGDSSRSIVEGIRSGRAFISRGPSGPKLLLRARTPHGIQWMGSEVRCKPGQEIALRVDARGGLGLGLRLISNSGDAFTASVDSTKFSRVFKQNVREGSFFRAELVEKFEGWQSALPHELEVAALTNAIHFKRVTDDGAKAS